MAEGTVAGAGRCSSGTQGGNCTVVQAASKSSGLACASKARLLRTEAVAQPEVGEKKGTAVIL